MPSECFVPNCKNTVGIPFPDDEEQKQKWLDALNITDLIPATTSFLCSDHFEDADKETENEDLTQEKNQGSNNKSNSEDETEKSQNQKQESNKQNSQEETKVKSEVPEVIMFDVDLKTCRLCMIEDINLLNIFEAEVVENVPILVSILACIHPIEISIDDELPKHVCTACVETLATCFKFRSICLKNDKTQREASANRGLKRKPFKIPKRTVKRLREDSDDSGEENRDPEPAPEPPKPQKSKSEIDAKFDRVEEELRKVLEGSLSEEQAASENIIIHIENDEDSNENDTHENDTQENDIPEVIPPSITTRRVFIPGDEDEVTSLPKTISLRPQKAVNRTYGRTSVGMYDGVNVSFAFDTKFCLVDGFLFEYRLKTSDRREMRCLTPNCPSSGYQWKTQDGKFAREVTILKPHNHKRVNVAERKKQMFHYVMRKKVQSDKTINFKGVYEDVCQYDPKIRDLVPLREIINIICRNPLLQSVPTVRSFEHLFNEIDKEAFEKFQFTFSGKQFFQEKITASDNTKAIIFANSHFVGEIMDSELMYVDASFNIDTNETFSYQLVTVLILVEDNYYPILYALINRKSQEIYKKIFGYLHDTLAPNLRPDEIVTDYEADLYYALGETYLDSSIGGSVFFYAKNIYKKICTLHLAKDLENNSSFRTIYHMLVMLPLLPVNTIVDGLSNIETQAKGLGLHDLTKDVFEHIQSEWITKVTPDLFCVHRLENRIHENVMSPFKKLRDLLTLSKGKLQKQNLTIVSVLNKIMDLEHFTLTMFNAPSKKAFIRNLSCSQKRNVLRAWQYIETHPKININNFFTKVVGYIKSMENQLWIWGYYRYGGEFNEGLINATNFSIVSSNVDIVAEKDDGMEYVEEFGEELEDDEERVSPIIMEAVITENGGVDYVLQNSGYKK
ncbi:unnamed protein product [Phaedon cochleariae]|uniref:Uncharacterized protein n=1 Tax=Phaedon cochleariae TaxID=80249 RepID=A0A9P0DHD0_PHACE|nr:unnamed protein product [Phaedon cochleariae]